MVSGLEERDDAGSGGGGRGSGGGGGSKQVQQSQHQDRRIDIQPAEDEEGYSSTLPFVTILLLKCFSFDF